jgi:flavodoxin
MGIKMKKLFKIIIGIFAALIIVVAAFGAIIFLDVASYTATGSQTLTPTGTSIGKALVVYDPGLSGSAKGVADKIASDLQAQNYTVTLAGIKSSAAASTTSYGVIVVGGPVYAGSPTVSVKDFLNSLKTGQGAKVGVFGSGAGATSPSDVSIIRNSVPALSDNGTLSNAVVVKIGQTEDLNTRAQDFVNQLLT